METTPTSRTGSGRHTSSRRGLKKSWWFKFLVTISVTVLAALVVAPTALKIDVENSWLPFKKKINLGLDLQGGVYLVMGADFNKVYAEVVKRTVDSLITGAAQKGVSCTLKDLLSARDADDPAVLVECASEANRKQLYDILKADYEILRIVQDNQLTYGLALTKAYRENVRERTISQSIEVVRNRIDEFGVSEPVISSRGTDRLSIELPGVKDVEHAKELIGRTAKLEFKIVDNESMSPDEVAALVSDIEAKNNIRYKEGEKFSEYAQRINDLAKGKIPAGTEIAFQREDARHNAQTGQAPGFGRVPYLLKARTEVTGDDLKDAFATMDPTDQRPIVSLSFNAKGTQNFDRVTGENLHKAMAIVLDGIVHMAPVIESRISNGQARITLGSYDNQAALREAQDIAIVLRAGALPAQLDFLEQRVVGPSLGLDSIEKGKLASIIGCLAVFVFMLLYYRGSGFVADISLIINVLLMMAILVALDATLTLPGIAGIALTVGIAVDSNVVIYERIREELRAGKPIVLAVESGFDKAFRTILDANVTNALAALILFNFGSGSIKGFAVTLIVGIVTTLFSAVFFCRMVFDFYLEKCNPKRLSI